ncbi:PilZ domain-containing protein [Paenibacillus sp. SYP-B3998]|uniref:PilZ domain-containing protein n=1 Tax=Paenibacillus sp. SYP-B3998 TaxID=2678564 RepID=A0A6G4A3F8_9BACL|nr:PilZ domain-containing protein [Paenibacillus sp. SYP-B3998]NEW08922.1 PilZ domain-containing protein [Paenibacillus sp. SYP-B3998]
MASGQELIKFYGSKEGNDSDILIDSKAVVSKKDFVSTGVLTYALGDIMEVELPHIEAFKLGDKVKVTIYSKSGLFVFETTVVAKDGGSLIVINPPENRRKFTEKREFPRIDVAQEGIIFGVHDMHKKNKHQFEQPIGFSIKNMSVNGLGFTIEDNSIVEKILQKHLHLEVELKLSFSLSCIMEVVRKEKRDHGFYYGARYIDILDTHTNALRGFILKNQVESYFIQKKDAEYRSQLEKKSPVNP